MYKISTQRPHATHSRHPTRTQLRIEKISPFFSCCLSCAARTLSAKRRTYKGDRRILVRIHSRELEFRFVPRRIWGRADPGRVHFVELPSRMPTRFVERGGRRNPCGSLAGVVASFWRLLDRSTARLDRDLELVHSLDLPPLVWIWFHFAVRVLRC